jgi:exopolysaccharide biosynthesis predicted pyruvyltransferase EpsI
MREQMKTAQNRQLIVRLQAEIHKVLAPLVPASGKIALLDFPHHSNVGDSAIWLGEIKYFYKTHKIRPAYVCTYANLSWEELDKAFPEGTIFLHGGGNFGDIWLVNQDFREQVLERFRNRKIVQLPQSLHFSNSEALKRAAGIINSHPDFTLLVRDYNSLITAKESFKCRIELCPDMAFYLGALKRPVQPSYKCLFLRRTDEERVEMAKAPTFIPETITTDWVIDDPDMYKIFNKIRWQTILELIPTLGIDALDKNKQRELYYRRLAEAQLKRGLRLLSSGSFVITDRLHAHILCTLLDIPHTTLDNTYGKLSSFIETWKTAPVVEAKSWIQRKPI